mmetsp:Transcript_24317/g.82053  ORF Transcript_24317/g.82053 Transcript_24317/m.82053 type:complete len:268 (-) Transcript_24317:92-895(-)
MSTLCPALRICSAAPAANLITSPWLIFAIVGMFLPTRGSLRVVFAISLTNRSSPMPLIRMSNLAPVRSAPSNLPPNLPKLRHLTSLASTAGVIASAENGTPSFSQWVTASSVSDRKTLPLDQHTHFGSSISSLETVVPLPVPERPCKTRTQPVLASAPSFATISPATWSADLPATLTLHTGSTGGFGSRTPRATASRIPAASFSASSSSRAMMPSISFLAKAAKVLSQAKAAMMAFEVESSPRFSSARESGTTGGAEESSIDSAWAK